MVFNSPTYIFIFLPVAVIVFYIFNTYRKEMVQFSKLWLIVASCFFYGSFNLNFLFFLIFSAAINFTIAEIMNKSRGKRIEYIGTAISSLDKRILISGIFFNLSLLLYCKHMNFFVQSINELFKTSVPFIEVFFPVGVSYFTFQQIAYLVDSYKSQRIEKNIINYSLFVFFFPKLIAGPIVRCNEIMPQIHQISMNALNWDNICKGVFLISIGLFKKIIIADSFAKWANAGFGSTDALLFLESWGTSLSYTLQIYYDFSGYTDMAIGSALLFQIKLPLNFNSPYKAHNIQEFWRRWHISLSRWLRDYLYIPLGGGRHGEYRTALNLAITMLLAGLWHGPGWTFLIWGGLHGIALILHRNWQGRGEMSRLGGWVVTILFINFSWVAFRAINVSIFVSMWKSMVGLNGFGVTVSSQGVINFVKTCVLLPFIQLQANVEIGSVTFAYILIFGFVAVVLPNSMELVGLKDYKGKFSFNYSMRYAVVTTFLFFLSVITFLGNNAASQFVYFNY